MPSDKSWVNKWIQGANRMREDQLLSFLQFQSVVGEPISKCPQGILIKKSKFVHLNKESTVQSGFCQMKVSLIEERKEENQEFAFQISTLKVKNDWKEAIRAIERKMPEKKRKNKKKR